MPNTVIHCTNHNISQPIARKQQSYSWRRTDFFFFNDIFHHIEDPWIFMALFYTQLDLGTFQLFYGWKTENTRADMNQLIK